MPHALRGAVKQHLPFTREAQEDLGLSSQQSRHAVAADVENLFVRERWKDAEVVDAEVALADPLAEKVRPSWARSRKSRETRRCRGSLLAITPSKSKTTPSSVTSLSLRRGIGT